MRSHRRVRPGRCGLFGSTEFPTAPSMTSDDEPPTQPRQSGGQDRKQREKRSGKEPLSQVSDEREAGNVEAEVGGEALEDEKRNGKRREMDGDGRRDVLAAVRLDRA